MPFHTLRPLRPATLLLCLLLAPSLLAAQPAAADGAAQQASPTRHAIERLSLKLARALQQGDEQAVDALCTVDAQAQAPDVAPAPGRAPLRDFARSLRLQGLRNLLLTTTRVDLAGDLAREHGTYLMALHPTDARPRVQRGSYELLWRRQPDGSWRLQQSRLAGR